MRTLVAIVLGLVLGAAAAIGLAIAVYSLEPAPSAPSTPATPEPEVVVPTATPAPTAAPTVAPTGTRSPSPFPLVGRQAPALVAPALDGATIDLSAYRGKPVWLVFGGTYCPPCRDEYPLMNKYAVAYADAGLVVLAVHVKEGAATVKPFVESLGVTFPVALDEDGSRARAWDAVALPVHYWIDATGIVREAAVGEVGPDVMLRNLAVIMPGVTIGGE